MNIMTTMNPVINVGTEKNPMMVLCATTMVMIYEEATGKNFGDDMDDYVNYCDGYREGYNEDHKEDLFNKREESS